MNLQIGIRQQKKRIDMKIKIKILEHGKDLPIPKKGSQYAACVDLYAAISETVELYQSGGVPDTLNTSSLYPLHLCFIIPF